MCSSFLEERWSLPSQTLTSPSLYSRRSGECKTGFCGLCLKGGGAQCEVHRA
jgi:hypothetical protein